MTSERSGCFSWLVSFKRSCNERWARFRNRFRERFYGRRGQAIDPATILNETGTSDIVIKKAGYKSNKVVPSNMASTAIVKDDPVIKNGPSAETDDSFERFVGEYVSSIISKATQSLRQASHSNTDVSMTKLADDNLSLSSSIISQLADTAVTESLMNIVLDTDTNQSAIHTPRPKTVKDFIKAFGIVGKDTEEGSLPHVSL